MKLISHRGNLNGPIKDKENQPEYINNAINSGFDCEIDVWYLNDNFYLGHDYPQYKIQIEFLLNNKLWCHAKNLSAFYNMLKNKNIHCFWHQKDDFTLTNQNFIWAYPNMPLSDLSVCVLPELGFCGKLEICHGICSDQILKYKNK